MATRALRYRRPTWGVLLLLACPGASMAKESPGPDAAGLGRAGAVAAADEHLGAHPWNPALVPLDSARGPRLMVDLRLDARQVTVRRWDSQSRFHAPLEPKLLPSLDLQAPLGLPGLWGSAWARALEDNETWFPGQDPDSPLLPGKYDLQRYGALRYRFQQSEYGISLAYRPRRWLSLGAALVGRTVRVAHERVLWAGTEASFATQPDSTADDLRIRISIRDPLLPEGRFGLFLRPLEPLRLGLSFSLPGVARMEGRASLPPMPSGRVITLKADTDASLGLRLPWVLRAAIGVDLGRVSLDSQVTYTDAPRPRAPRVKTLGLLVHRVESPTVQVPISEVRLGPVFRSRLALGASVRVVALRPWLELSLGYVFSQGAASPAWTSAALIDPDLHAFTAGLTLRRGALRLDLGYARILASRRGGPGLARQENPIAPGAAAAISSGLETRHGDMAAVSVTLELAPRH
ncbi:MAG: hypothetical protein RBU30_12665 [Polyangia bacterium]|nr:hypothetical protein [Polyangia bacterium]